MCNDLDYKDKGFRAGIANQFISKLALYDGVTGTGADAADHAFSSSKGPF